MRQIANLLFIKHDEILLVKKKNLWILPGGKIRRRKSGLESLEKEIGEELNTRIFIGNFYKSFSRINFFGRDFLEVKTYFGSFIKNMTSLNETGDIRFVSDAYEYPVSGITKKIIDSLGRDGYFYD